MKHAVLLLLLTFQEDVEDKIRKEVAMANHTTLAFQVQAVTRLKARGAAAAPHLVAYVNARGANALTLACAEVFTDIVDPSIATLCAKLVEDRNFFWRPAAARGLAEQKSKDHLELLRKLMTDRLWGVRAAAIVGLERLGDKPSAEAVTKALDDDIYDVRAQAAKTLFAFGDESGLPVLVESLRSDVRWFDIDYGQLAREDSWNFLKKIAKDEFGFKPWETVAQREPGLKLWDAWMEGKAPGWRDKLPAKARVTPDPSEYAFGFELRSCRTGDYFWRLDTTGQLVIGYFNLVRAKLTPDELAKLQKAIEGASKVDRRTAYGEGGCDFEQYYFRSADGKKFEKLWMGVRGRPGQLDGFIRTVADLILAKFGEGEAKEFKSSTSIFREMD